MIEGADKITSEASYDEAGNLHLLVRSAETGLVTGEQIRYKNGSIKFTKGIATARSAPLVINPLGRRQTIFTEGPTDAIAVARCPQLSGAQIIGCWSSSTLPPVEWVRKNVPSPSLVSSYVLGDGDPAGWAFNQRVANLLGWVMPVAIPMGCDARKIIEEQGCDELVKLLAKSHNDRILIQESVPKVRKQRDFQGLTDAPLGDIVSLVESAGGKLKSTLTGGQRKYLCPLHDDRHDPSLTVDPESGSWKCWAGCGKGGPAQFVQAWRGLSWREAMLWLESRR